MKLGVKMRYIGNKRKLLTEIKSVIDKNVSGEELVFCDLFAGTGTVGSYFRDKYKIIANDKLRLSYVLSHGYINSKQNNDYENLGYDPIEYLNNGEGIKGFFYNNYSPGNSERMYFTEKNAMKIDFIRTTIEKWYLDERIDEDEYYYLLVVLLEAVSLRANIAGVYGAYLKKWDSRALKDLILVDIELNNVSKYDNEIFNLDSMDLIEHISGDILYIDPPYSKNDYSTQYHILETLVKYDNPVIKGKTGTRQDKVKSEFTKPIYAEIALEKIISEANFDHIIMSYNNNGVIPIEYIETLLKKHAVKFIKKEIEYQNYTNKKSLTNSKNREYLFYIKKNHSVYIESPLNYMGSKYQVLDEIVPKINGFNNVIDIFAGGFNVGINTDCKHLVFNDINHYVKDLIELFSREDIAIVIKKIQHLIEKYGLEKSNKETYMKFREIYNSNEVESRSIIELYVLIQFGFQQQLRFNNSHDFNNPVGMSSFNTNTLIKIIEFNRAIRRKAVTFFSQDFNNLQFRINEDTVVYLDPPYLITLGSYNDGKRGFKGWNKELEMKLYNYIDDVVSQGGNFVLSNILQYKGHTNEILFNWLSKRDYIVKKYTHRKREEILVSNF